MFGKKNKQPETPVTAKSAGPAAVATKVSRTSASPAQGQNQAKGKLAYEIRRAEKAGMGLEKWMAEKDRRARSEREAIAQARRKSGADLQNQAAKPGLLRRLLDRAHRPF